MIKSLRERISKGEKIMRKNQRGMPQYVTSWEEVPLMVDTGYIARLFGVCKETARRLCMTGELPAFKLCEQWYVSKEALMIFCRAGVSNER